MPHPKKPTALKLIQGNPGKGKISDREPIPESEASPPDWLVEKPDAMAEWNRLAPELIELGMLTNLDQFLFACYCDCVARFTKARAEVEKVGELVRGPNSTDDRPTWQYNPWMAIMRREQEFARKLAGVLGLSPSDRSGIEVERKTPASDLMKKMLNRHKGPHAPNKVD